MTTTKKETLAQYLSRGGVITVCKPKKAPRVPESDNKMHNKANGHRKAMHPSTD